MEQSWRNPAASANIVGETAQTEVEKGSSVLRYAIFIPLPKTTPADGNYTGLRLARCRRRALRHGQNFRGRHHYRAATGAYLLGHPHPD